MFKAAFTICLLTSLSLIGNAQNAELYQIELNLVKVPHNIAFSCTWVMEGKKKDNELLIFTREDSTKYEVEFFKTKDLPFYQQNNTNFQTAKAFILWEKNLMKDSKSLSFSPVEEDQELDYVVVKMKSKTKEFYRMLISTAEITYSVKLYPYGELSDEDLVSIKEIGFLNKAVK